MKNTLMATHLRLVGMAALWGASWSWGKVVAQSMAPLAAASLRFLFASVVLVLWMQRASALRGLKSLSRNQWLGLAAAALAGVFGYSSFFMLSLQLVPAGKAAIVVTLNPGVTLLLAAILFREHLNPAILAGMVLSAIGAYIAIGGGSSQASDGASVGFGGLLLLGCVACWVAYTLIGRLVLKGVDALTTTTVTTVIGALMLLLTSLIVEGVPAWQKLAQAPASAWGSLLALAFGATAIAYAWYFEGVKALGAGAASGYITLVPVFGVLFSSLWLGEATPANLFIGAALAISGMAMMHVGRRRAEQATAKTPKTLRSTRP
ncbi:DMT family transporter [Achromobacter sp. Bel]|uniref:DMT family transporter n=1 Tax=Achromobacter sp. Bel TaxID=2727415 RepID=UPI00145D5106|nr:DMT family transporter [Achromobacter sp. Bel]NMK44797.1 DMT family transporter [Achromobacter sp. Bel]